MTLFFPQAKDLLMVEEDWKFPLFYNRHNYKILQKIEKQNLKPIGSMHTFSNLFAEEFLTVPKGTTISLEVYEIKQRMEKWDGIAFKVIKSDAKIFYNDGNFFKFRFFAKLCDVNRAKLSLVEKKQLDLFAGYLDEQ